MHALNSLSIVLVLLLICVYFYPSDGLEFRYHSNEELEQVMRNFSESTRNIHTDLYTIGKSSNGNNLWVMELSGFRKDSPDLPNIKYVANIHGNEAVGRELLLHFMEYLRDNYEKDHQVKCLLDNTRIHLMPSMNPDGFAVANQGRCNGELGRNNGVDGGKEDLNRNFPDFYHVNMNPRQPESEAVIRWMDRVPFTLSAGLHGGAMVANYPFDTERKTMSSPKRHPSLTPDNDVFEYLASTYAQNHPKMKYGLCEDGRNPRVFENGITNGASWYSFAGGMQDYNYFKKGCMEVTLEISCCKYPRPEELEKLWEQNKQSLLKYSLRALEGISGQVIDNTTGLPIKNASLEIIGRNMTFFSTSDGYFWRILLPGRYKLKVDAPGYSTRLIEFEVDNQTKQFCPRKKKFRIEMNVTPASTSNFDLNDRFTSEQNVSKFREAKSISAQALTEGRILNNFGEKVTSPKDVFPLPPEEESKIFRMIFGDPNKFNKNLTERDIRTFMMHEMNITDTTNFDSILRDFDKKNDSEKAKVLSKLAEIFKGVLHTFTSEYTVRVYMREKLHITDFSPYAGTLKDFDKKSAIEKKEALDELLKIYLSYKPPKNNGVSLTHNIFVNVYISTFIIIFFLY